MMRFDKSEFEEITLLPGNMLTKFSVIALSKLYSLNDQRVSQTMVKGDLIIPTSDRIMTRSQAKLSKLLPTDDCFIFVLTIPDPDQYTIIPAQLKIIKVLIQELESASGLHSASNAAAAAAAEFADEEGENDDWEDVPSTIDLGLGSTKADLMAFGDGSASFLRQKDDETQASLLPQSFCHLFQTNEFGGLLSGQGKCKESLA